MRLTELEPQWLERDGRKVGVMFLCPHCREAWLTCFWVAMPTWGAEVDAPYMWEGQFGFIREALDRQGWDEPENNVVPCKAGLAWQWNGEGFERMSLTPSLDASASGHWHGFITDGEIR